MHLSNYNIAFAMNYHSNLAILFGDSVNRVWAFEHYDLRQRIYNFSLPARTSHLADNNVIQRNVIP